MSKSKPITNTCKFCLGAEAFGNKSPDVHKLLWYMANSPMVSFGVLESFQRYLAEYNDVILKDLKSKGKSYPG